jgi:hypothetical protein
VSSDRFDEVVAQRCGRPNAGSAKERSKLHALDRGKINSRDAGLSTTRRELEAGLKMRVDFSVIRRGGPFDMPPFMGAAS